MSMLDFFSGGKSGDAIDALNRAEQYFGSVKTPTTQDLTLPELQKYVEMGVMTPAEAQAYLQKSNAFADQNINQTGTDAQIQALNKLSAISDAGPQGTPMQQAQLENSLSQLNTSVGGQRGAIEQGMAARGTPYALIQAALENQTVGQDAQQAHLDAVNGQGAAWQNALNALSQQGNVGSSLQGQQNAQSNQVAAAQNAMQQFNAANQQNAAQANANRSQEANAYNTQNKQQVANNNTGLSNTRTQYNAQVPQQVFSDQMQKAAGQAGAATNIGDMQQKQGQQNAGLWSGIINTGTSFIPKPGAGAAPQAAHGAYVDENGRMCMADGAIVPGEASFEGDTVANDKVPADLSPGEAVIPRTSVAENPDMVSSLLNGEDSSSIDFQDVALLLKALRSIRMGVA